MRRCLRWPWFLLSLIGLANPLFPQAVGKPHFFDHKTFEQMRKQGPREQIPWKIRLSSTGPSFFQRLTAHVEIEADADHILKRSRNGQVIAMIQLADSKGQTYPNDAKVELSDMAKVRNANLVFSWDAFVLPGDYSVELALYDTHSEEHDFAQRRLHVPPLKPDMLPGAWQELPAVEFWTPKDTQDSDNLFHPDIDGRLKLQIATARPLRIEVLADLTPSEIFRGSHTLYTQYLGAVVPTLKVFSQVDLPNGVLDVATFDLKDRKVTFEEEINAQNNADSNSGDNAASGLDWPRLKETLKESDPGTINVRALQDRHPSPIFLRDELVRRITAGNAKTAAERNSPLRVYVLLSGPLDSYSFNGAQFKSIPESLPETCACLIYYVEYDLSWWKPGYRPGGRPGGRPWERNGPASTVGEVEKMLKPFKIRPFSVTSAHDVRHALATMLDEIAKAGSN